MRRVATDRVSVWVAMGTAVSEVTLSIYSHATAVVDSTTTPIASASVTPIRVGEGLFFALPTVEVADAVLLPGTMYDYDVSFDGQTLGALGLLSKTPINGHPHVPLGYVEGMLPSFVTRPDKADKLIIAHGSCRRPYAEGTDAVVALDQLIKANREGPRPHFLFFTGDQIYADDLSNEMLRWANDVGRKLVGLRPDGHAIEHLRVEVPEATTDIESDNPGDTEDDPDRGKPTHQVRFPADVRHFPPGRRARLCARAANLTSDDNQNHALSFGEIAAHYLFSWCNVAWPKKLTDAGDWKQLLADRGADVERYLDAWRLTFGKVQTAYRASPDIDLPADAKVDERLPRIDGWQLLPEEYRAIDQFLQPSQLEWQGKTSYWQAWLAFWGATTPPEPTPPATSIPATDFLATAPDLQGLARYLTPSWYAGQRHFHVGLRSYDVTSTEPLPPPFLIEITQDDVIVRLQRLRSFYEGLPYVRRALANVSTLMMFDDHEVTDDWTVSAVWMDNIKNRALGRDVMTNALAAYLLFQDWGNDHRRYVDDTPNRAALETIQKMFRDGANARPLGPEDAERQRLEELFGFSKEASSPLLAQATWAFSITDPVQAPYEILFLDNRTKRGYDVGEDGPANLSLAQIQTQVPEQPPETSAVTIVIAPLPVVGYPPMEEILQPVTMLTDGIKHSHSRPSSPQTFPTIERDYEFGTLIRDPEAWSLNTAAQEALLQRLSSRRAVVLLSGDIHFAITGKVTYWHKGATTYLEPASRIAALVSSALKNVPGGIANVLATLRVGEEIGALIAGPYDRLGWAQGGVNGPNFDASEGSFLLRQRMRKNPAIIPVRMLPKPVVQQLRSHTLPRPPEWAWRFEVVKDLRDEAIRYQSMPGAAGDLALPTEAQLAANPRAAIEQIARQHVWTSQHGFPRRTVFDSNVGIVTFERTIVGDETTPLVVVHALHMFDRNNLGPGGAAPLAGVPWPEARLEAQPFTEYRVSLDPADQRAPDRPDPTEPP